MTQLTLIPDAPLRVIVAGSRSIDDFDLVAGAVQRSGFAVGAVLSGGARGVDRLGERWAMARGVPVHRYPASWEEDGHAAGLVRNEQMAAAADALIAVWDGASFGTAHMIRAARSRNLRIYVERMK